MPILRSCWSTSEVELLLFFSKGSTKNVCNPFTHTAVVKLYIIQVVLSRKINPGNAHTPDSRSVSLTTVCGQRGVSIRHTVPPSQTHWTLKSVPCHVCVCRHAASSSPGGKLQRRPAVSRSPCGFSGICSLCQKTSPEKVRWKRDMVKELLLKQWSKKNI